MLYSTAAVLGACAINDMSAMIYLAAVLEKLLPSTACSGQSLTSGAVSRVFCYQPRQEEHKHRCSAATAAAPCVKERQEQAQ